MKLSTLDSTRWNKLGGVVDPARDTRVGGTFIYRARRNAVDNSVWLPATSGGPGGIIRLTPGTRPPYSCQAEFYEPPKLADGVYDSYLPQNVDFDTQGRVWIASVSGRLAVFDRRKCKTLSGPSATGQQCPEGWKTYGTPSPHYVGTGIPVDFNYGLMVDNRNTLGLGNDLVVASGSSSDSIFALDPKTGKSTVIRVPYPRGFYTRDISGRIDAPGGDWKSRSVWGSYNTIPVWENEGADDGSPGLVRIQMRPSPLAR